MSIPNSDLDLQLSQHHSLLNLVLSYPNVPVGRPPLKASNVALGGEEAAVLAIEALDSEKHYSILFSIVRQAGSLWPSPRECQVPPTREVSVVKARDGRHVSIRYPAALAGVAAAALLLAACSSSSSSTPSTSSTPSSSSTQSASAAAASALGTPQQA